jgi:uncharacterized protein DUF929
MPQQTATRSQRRARQEREHAAARQRRLVVLAAAVIVVVLLGLVAARWLTSNSTTPTAEGPASDALMKQVTSLPAASFEQVGKGSLVSLPTAVRADVERGPAGLPIVYYIGAEYCPFCAGERWPLVLALSRFGTFSGLRLTHSASDDVYPNTATFSFVGASYASPYVSLSAVELQSNVRSGNTYRALQTPTADQTRVLQKYNAAPYVPASSAGSIPFIDFAGQYVVSGASFDVGVLRGLSQDQIALTLADTNSAQSRAILGSANALTAAICSATGDSPSDVCGLGAVKSLEASLAGQPAPAPR